MAAFCRVLSPDVPEATDDALAVYAKVAGFMKKQILDSIETDCTPRNVLDERARIGRLLKSKPAAFVDNLMEARRQREVVGQVAKEKKCGWFVKWECSGKMAGQTVLVKPRGIYPMTDRLALENAPVLEAINAFYHSPIVTRFHVKGTLPSNIGEKVASVTQSGAFTVTDYSSFEASLTGLITRTEEELLTEIMRRLGNHDEAFVYERNKTQLRSFSNGLLSFLHRARKSGDFETAGGNLHDNLIVILTQSYVKYERETGDSDLDRWWATVDSLFFVLEGDDAVVPKGLIDLDLVSHLGFKFSQAESGELHSDCDFLHKVYYPDGGVLVNVLRGFRSLYTDTAQKLRNSKVLALARASAWSMWCSSPGHPILWAVVRRIGQLTSGVSMFKGWQKFKKDNNPLNALVAPPSRFPQTFVSQKLRVELATTRNPLIPCISIPEQVAFEDQILRWRVGEALQALEALSSYPEFPFMLVAPHLPQREIDGTESPGVRRLLGQLGVMGGVPSQPSV